MMKNIFIGIIFSVMGLLNSESYAQCYTMHELIIKNIEEEDVPKGYLISLEVPNQNIVIGLSFYEEANYMSPPRLIINGSPISFNNSAKIQYYPTSKQFRGRSEVKVGNRIHIINLNSETKKYIYVFYDDIRTEVEQKLKEKGF